MAVREPAQGRSGPAGSRAVPSTLRARRGGTKGVLAFVSPRFGREILGGAEFVLREMALGLLGRGWRVEVLTTCATNPYTWANELPAGEKVEDGILVRRFENLLASSGSKEHWVHGRIYGGETPSLDDQVTWLNALFRTPGLFEALYRERERFHAVIFAPYLFWTTTVCMPAVADRAIVMPCLHDEVYARLEVMRHVLALPASVWFLSEPEHELAHSLGPVAPHHRVIGAGMDVPARHDPAAFRAEHGIEGPFLLYLNRRETDKGWPWLLEVFADAGTPVKLVSAGPGAADVPPYLRHRVIDVGVLSNEQRDNALAAALAFVQPSLMESYSRTVMEAWLARTPVLVRRGSKVLEWHCARSQGGLAFSEGPELAAIVDRLAAEPQRAAEMGERGRAYVLGNYQWPQVLDRVESDLVWLQAGAEAPTGQLPDPAQDGAARRSPDGSPGHAKERVLS